MAPSRLPQCLDRDDTEDSCYRGRQEKQEGRAQGRRERDPLGIRNKQLYHVEVGTALALQVEQPTRERRF